MSIYQVLEQYGPIVKPELVLCILPQHGTDIRQVLKNWGDVKRSVSTQCVVCIIDNIDQTCFTKTNCIAGWKMGEGK